MAAEPDFYRVLGVRPTAERDEIRRAHRRIVRAVHPDRQPGASDAERRLAERRMREVNEAWYVLSDDSRRSGYDRRRAAASPPPAPGRAAAARPPRPRPTSPPPRPSEPRRSPFHGAPGPSSNGGSASWDDDEESDGFPVSPGTAKLLRFGPIVTLVVVLVGLFVVTAVVGGGSGDTRSVPDNTCVTLVGSGEGFLVSCAIPNDGEVVAEVETALSCPSGTRYVRSGTEFFCIPSE